MAVIILMENRKRIITAFCLNCDILIDLISPIHHAAPDNTRESRFSLGNLKFRGIKRALYRECPSVAGIYTFLDLETRSAGAPRGIRPSDNLRRD